MPWSCAGKGIRTARFVRNPPSCPRSRMAACTPLVSAALRPCTASSWDSEVRLEIIPGFPCCVALAGREASVARNGRAITAAISSGRMIKNFLIPCFIEGVQVPRRTWPEPLVRATALAEMLLGPEPKPPVPELEYDICGTGYEGTNRQEKLTPPGIRENACPASMLCAS
jgi:hypothetical protein